MVNQLFAEEAEYTGHVLPSVKARAREAAWRCPLRHGAFGSTGPQSLRLAGPGAERPWRWVCTLFPGPHCSQALPAGRPRKRV